MRSSDCRLTIAALVASAILALASHAGAQTSSARDVAVTPFTVAAGKDDALRAVSARCFEQFVAALTLKGVKIARDPQLSENNLQSAQAPWAVLGSLSHEEGQFQLELRLLQVKSGEEMRSYFNADKEPQLACRAVEKAAERIAAFVKEQERSQ